MRANVFFITGMLRSGTSLLQTILTNHPDLFVAYQPYNQFFIDIKNLFLNEKCMQRMLPLGDGLEDSEKDKVDFIEWLSSKVFSSEDVLKLSQSCVQGKGGSARDLLGLISLESGNFFSLHKQLVNELAKFYSESSQNNKWIGTKEILCEEFLPFFNLIQIPNFLIIRDPRAMICSACHGKYLDQVKDRYPILMLIRLWRKSVEYINLLKDSPYFHWLRYEDLVLNQKFEVDRITQRLKVSEFKKVQLKQNLLDHKGQEWKGNSSFGEKNGVDSVLNESWRELLTYEEIRFIEACTIKEREQLGYLGSSDLNAGDIQNFFENTELVRSSYLSHYALNDINRNFEINRQNEALSKEIAKYQTSNALL